MRGVLIMVLAIIAGIVVAATMSDPSEMVAEGWGIGAVGVAGAAVQLIDAYRWSGEHRDTP